MIFEIVQNSANLMQIETNLCTILANCDFGQVAVPGWPVVTCADSVEPTRIECYTQNYLNIKIEANVSASFGTDRWQARNAHD